MSDNVQKLEKEFQFRKNTYKQLEEGDNYYLYGVWNLKQNAVGEPSYYEIFKKTIEKERTMQFNDKVYPQREIYPSDSHFGRWAWCCTSMERVNEIKQEESLV